MNEIRDTSGALDGSGLRFALVASRFNARIVDRLVDAAADCLLRHGVAADDVEVVRVPGAWELPLALEALAASGRFQGLVALGAVIRGETPHFDYVAGEASRGIARVQTEHRVPVGFGLLTTDTSAQAEERSGGKAGNKGWDAALAALEMASLLARLREDGGQDGGQGAGGGG